MGFFSVLLVVERKSEIQREYERLDKAVKVTNDFIERQMPTVFLDEHLKDLSVKLLDPTKLSFLVKDLTPTDFFTRNRNSFLLYRLNDKKIIMVKIDDYRIVFFEDSRKRDSVRSSLIFVGFMLSFITITITYVGVLEKLTPLRKLEQNVIMFGRGKPLESIDTSGSDEISTLAKSFTETAKRLTKLKMSREFFIRNIMHELKTPITKGKITTQLLPHSENKERLERVFTRLELLIKEFAPLEKMIAEARQKDCKLFRIVDLIDGARDLLFETGTILTKNINTSIKVDYELFTIIFKNLIENAFKYSSNKTVQIEEQRGDLRFVSKGERMKNSLSFYKMPFTKDSKDGLGLGLYIVDMALKNHDIKLQYTYENGCNIFYFSIQDQSVQDLGAPKI